MRSVASGWVGLVVAVVVAACSQDSVTQPAGAARAPAAHPAGYRGASASSDGHHVAILDECDPSDPAWAPTGGCTLKHGDVSFAEFQALVGSPHANDVVGHPGWRNDPSYLSVPNGTTVKVRNEGGRAHTFTWVAQFGGGRVPPLNRALRPAPECLSPAVVTLQPGDSQDVPAASDGINRYQCCIHPWMRAEIKVQ
jgi:plastocyanin